MTSRINIARPAGASPYSPSYSPDPHGFGTSRPSSSGFRAANGTDSDDSLAKLRTFASKIEDYIEIYSQPLKPHLPAIGRFLIIVTFLEDAWRIMTQWSDQLWYLQRHRKFPWGLSHTFLLLNVIVSFFLVSRNANKKRVIRILFDEVSENLHAAFVLTYSSASAPFFLILTSLQVMVIASGAVITKRHTEYAVIGLLGVVIVQGFGYGLIFDLTFFLRNLSVIGGLFMVFSDSMISRKSPFAGLPSISETDRKKYFLLAGRVLLIFLFLGFMIQGKWSIGRVFVSIVGLIACIMVAVGFKAKWSAAFLVLVLSVFNVIVNNFWAVHSAHPQRDFLKYDFFQTLSIVGGLLLLVNMGPGGLSVDEKKKVY